MSDGPVLNPELLAKLDHWTRNKRENTKEGVIDWTRELYIELIDRWHRGHTAQEIASDWMSRGLWLKEDKQKRDHRGAVDGMIRRMQEADLIKRRDGLPPRPTHPPPRPKYQGPSYRQIVQKRRERAMIGGKTFENLSREERGLPPAEIAQEQHPDFPAGINRDAAHRIEHGRTLLWSAADRERMLNKRDLLTMLRTLYALARAPRPAYQTLDKSQKDLVRSSLIHKLPAIRLLCEFLETALHDLNMDADLAPSEMPVITERELGDE